MATKPGSIPGRGTKHPQQVRGSTQYRKVESCRRPTRPTPGT
nr:MAG TPA: hypothetical protein [Caudoviricetes sp.]